MNPVYIDIGEFIKPHGILGELLFNLYNPLSNVMDSECELFIKENGAYKKLEIEKIRRANKGYLIKLNGADSIESAEKFKKTSVYINKADIKLDKDEFLISDLIGLNCYNEKKINIGSVSEIYGGETDVMEIKSCAAVYLIPMTAENIETIDIKNSKISVKNENNYRI